MLCPAAWHVRPDHLPTRAEWVQRVQICSLWTSQRGPTLPFQKVRLKGFRFRKRINHLPFRANENGGLLGKVEKEKMLLKQELIARIKVILFHATIEKDGILI